MSKLKKRNRVLIGLGILIIFVIILWNNNRRLEFSVHDLNWEDIIGMNERISDATFTNPPYNFDDPVRGVGHLNILLSFFNNNLDSISDISRRNNPSVRLYFRGITGHEPFLGEIPAHVWENNNGDFQLNFYFERDLNREFFDALNASGQERFEYENPHSVNIYTPLENIDWDKVLSGYETLVSAILIQGVYDESVRIFRFSTENPGTKNILYFLETNWHRFKNYETENYSLGGTIHLTETSDIGQRNLVSFFMDDTLSEELIIFIGYDVWEQALR